MKNKILSLFISVITLFTVTACNTSTTQDNGKLQIVTTLFPQYDFARAVAGDNADITLLLTPGSESHSFEPTAADIAKIQQADLFIFNGGESEIWVDRILDSAGNIPTLRLMDCVSPLEEEHNHEEDEHNHEEDEHNHEEDEHSHEEDEHVGEYDEHIFTSLKNSVAMLEEINNSVCSIDKDNASLYTENTEKYKAELEKLDKDFSEMISSAKTKTVVLADRNPFRYFAEDYAIDFHAAFTGCSHDTDASPATISELITDVQENNIPIIFTIEFSSQDIAGKISEATGAKIGLLHSCHNISKEDFENGVTYLQLMKNNFDILSEALN